MGDEGLPKSTMLKAIKERLPAELRLAGDAAEPLMRCCDEFVHALSSTANAISDKEKKTTIMPEHIIKSLEELGYTPYLGDINQAWESWKEERKEAAKVEKERKAARKDTKGMNEQELLELQQRLFMEARNNTGMDPAAEAATATAAPTGAPEQAAANVVGQQQEQPQHPEAGPAITNQAGS